MSCILSNPDITGIGVRTAIYAQNLFSFIPAAFVLWDNKITYYELETIEQQSSTILITAFALLFSAIIQTRTFGLSNLHAAVILNLSWMNNTNLFIYFLIYVYRRIELREQHKDKWDILKEAWKVLKDRVLWIGIGHFILMGGFGIWLWKQPSAFGNSDGCTLAASVIVLGQRVSLTSKSLRNWSLLVYSFLSTPIVNMFVPAALFLSPIVYSYRRADKYYSSPEESLHHIRRLFVIPLFIFLFAINLVFLVDTEVMLRVNRELLQQGDGAWTFGQTLALLLLLVPLRDFYDTFVERRGRRRVVMETFVEESSKGRWKVVRELLDEEPDGQTKGREFRCAYINKNDILADHALMVAAAYGRPLVMKYLLDSRPGGTTGENMAFLLAACRKQQRVVKWLADRYICGKKEDELVLNPLRSAANQEHWDIVKVLVERIIGITPDFEETKRAFLTAAKEGLMDCVKVLHEVVCEINVTNDRRETALHLAAAGGHTDIVIWLIEKKANVELKDGMEETALHKAAQNSHPEVVEHLCSKQARVNATNNNGETALHKATSSCCLQAIQILRENKANLDAMDNLGETPLFKAVKGGKLEVVQCLCDHDPRTNGNAGNNETTAASRKVSRVNVKNKSGETPLFLAVLARSLVMVKYLCDNKANINSKKITMETPLHYAALNGSLDIVEYLCEKCEEKPELDAKDDIGETPLHNAAMSGHKEVVKYLCDNGASVNLKNAEGLTPHEIALKADHLGVSGYLELVSQATKNIKSDPMDPEECISLYRESLMLRPEPDPKRASLLQRLSRVLRTGSRRTGKTQDLNGDDQDLEEFIGIYRESLSLHPPHSNRSALLSNLAGALMARFQRNRDFQDLEECTSLYRESLSLIPSEHPNRSALLSNLAGALMARFQRNRDFQDLEECTSLYRESLSLIPSRHPNRSALLSNLAGALMARFQRNRDFQDLEECTSLYRESLSLIPSEHPNRSALLSNLAGALMARFQWNGDFQDLEECTSLYRELLSLIPSRHPNRSALLSNLAGALMARFQWNGDFQDLEECTSLYRELLSLIPSWHPNRSALLSNLAGALMARFQRNRDFQDLEECTSLYRESLSLIPSEHPNRSALLSNLAGALMARFQWNGDFQDLEECTSLYRESLSFIPSWHPNRSALLSNLAGALMARFQRNGDFQDLDGCTSLYRESLSLMPPPHPNRFASLYKLAVALVTRFKAHENSNELFAAFDLLKEASHYDPGSLFDRLNIAKDWANWAREYHHPSVMDAYQCAIGILPCLASLDLNFQQRQRVLTQTGQLTSDAAQCAIEQNRLDTAIIFLSASRFVFWSHGLHIRMPLDLLAEKEPDLARKIRNYSEQLENVAYLPRDSAVPDASDLKRLSSLVKQRHKAIEKVRKIKGFEDFLLLPSFEYLQRAARHGPIILLNASQYGCDALIIGQAEVPVQRVQLSSIFSLLIALKNMVQLLAKGARIDSVTIEDVERALPAEQFPAVPTPSEADAISDSKPHMQRHMGHEVRKYDNSQNAFKCVLGILWVVVVEPVVRALELKKTSSPARIWWHPTGPFTFLPIHAAGLYSEDSVCLSDYAVSSYCSSLQALISTEEMEIPAPFKMFAVIEPNAEGGNPLPWTVIELEKIKSHLPDQHDLIPYENSAKSPMPLDTVLNNIRQSSCVHFACHVKQDLTDPLKSFLLLSSGKLMIQRINQECQSSASLVYLSGCETAKADEEWPSDESLNLVATMSFAGFRSVIGTMWSIQGKYSPVVANEFYSHLFRNGTAKSPDITDAAEALHLAVNDLRKRGRPFKDWVPFVHSGI